MPRIALIQMSCGRDMDANRTRAARLVREAAGGGADLVCLQELFAGIYFPQYVEEQYQWWAEPIPGPTSEQLSRLAAELGIVLIGSIYESAMPGLQFNTAVVFERDGRLLGKARKAHIPEDPGYTEKYYFAPGDSDYPVFATSCGKLAVPTCWDQWFPEVARIAALKGAEMIFYPTAIGSAPGNARPGEAQDHEAWELVMRAHAVTNGCYVAAVNRVGREDGITFWGGSFVANPAGQLLAKAGAEEQVLYADADLDRVRHYRLQAPFFRDRRPETYGALLKKVVES